MTLGLGNMRALLDALGQPEKTIPSVVVAGTNGKGSVTAYLSAILAANGRRVGWYSSPHVYAVGERVQVNNEPVPIETLESAAEKIVPLHERIQYSYFEALTAIAFLVFAEAGVDYAVLETGLGGRFDATNVVDPEVSVLTSISQDHRRILGDSDEEILREKLGITRPDVPLLVGPLSPDLFAIVEEKARRDGFPLKPVRDIGNADVVEMSFSSCRVKLRTQREDYGTVPLPFLGGHQLDNALLALGSAECLLGEVKNLEAAAGLAYLPGRFEVLSVAGRTVILDVAHNDDALMATTKTLVALSPRERNAIVLGMLQRKELNEFPRTLPRWAGRYYLVEADAEDRCASTTLLERIGLDAIRSSGTDVIVARYGGGNEERDEFIASLLHRSNPVDVILITGSHRTVETFGRRLFSKGVA
jgi:dihydrofolate synthase/folylpolyglutamate synthase